MLSNETTPTAPAQPLGELLWQRLQRDPIADTLRWMEKNHPDMLVRISRLTVIDDEYCLDNLAYIVPPNELRKLPAFDRTTTIWRGVPSNARIRPGDWVALSREYAQQHGPRTGEDACIDMLEMVDVDDVYWAGTDMNEFFYLPKAWQGGGRTVEQHLQSLSRDKVLAFADGELSALAQHAQSLTAIREHVEGAFDAEACGTFHGPAHWQRVSQHAVAAARALGISPLVPYVFALVHDSQREDDDLDVNHGPRAAAFVRARRGDLFAFLDDEQIGHLALACEEHSCGGTEGHIYVQACWDADRLDLGRVNICPDPQYLCTEYARQPDVIRDALKMSGAFDLVEQVDEVATWRAGFR